MLELKRMEILHLAAHYVGNFGLGEDLTLGEKPFIFNDNTTKDVFFNYLMSGFKTDIQYHFAKNSEFAIYDVKDSVEKIFNSKSEDDFMESSKKIASHLYKQTMHPKIKGGELYIAKIKDVIINGELCDAVGIFKSESKDTYIKVDLTSNTFFIEAELGINPKKLDKGVLIFNIEKENGYKAVVIDNSSKISEAQHYWFKDFLDMELKDSPYLNTMNYIDQSVQFCNEVLTEENKFDKKDFMMFLNDSVNFFGDNVEFNQQVFEQEVFKGDDALIEKFREYQETYRKTYGTKQVDEFQISKTAVKQNTKYMKSLITLDGNIEINIYSGHDLIEQGYDEDKKMKFYKIFYINED
jgi:hypothetical protein